MGERDSPEGQALDAALMPLITSVNIACGGHAGSPDLMRRTARLAAQYNLAIGAHPGIPDPESFGRTERAMHQIEIQDLIVEQVQRLRAVLATERLTLTHVKPHGALYNMAARDPIVAQAIVTAILQLDRRLLLYALAGSILARIAQEASLGIVHEAFADRAYRADGSLVPRTERGAILDDEDKVRQQLHQLIDGSVVSADGQRLPIRADSLCLHSDTAHSVALARMIRQQLDLAHVTVASVLNAAD